MANKFKKPEPVDKETLEAALKDTSSFISFQLAFQGLGIKLEKPGQKTPESDGVPRIFLIKGDDPNDPFSLEEANAPVGSPAFVEALLSGQIFAFPNGEQRPVQMQGTLEGGKLVTERSTPIDYEDPRDELPEEPAEPPRPKWYHRLFGFLPANRARIAEHTRWQTEHAKWEEEIPKLKAERQAEYEERKDEIAAAEVAYHFSVVRGEAAFKADREMQELVDRDEARRQAEIVEENQIKFRDTGIDLMIGLYETHPRFREEWLKKEGPKDNNGFYTEEQFKELTTADIDPAEVKIGGQGLTEREFAALAMFAATNEETCLRQQKKAVSDPVGAIEGFKKAGYTEARAKRLVADSFNSTFTLDLLSKDPRVYKYFDAVNEGRALAAEALKSYQNGDKTKLAEILGRAVEHGGMYVGVSGGRGVPGIAKLGGEMLELMERDPELRDMAKQSFEKRERSYTENTRIPSLSFDKLVENIQKMKKFEDLSRKGSERRAEIFRARAEGKELTAAQKKECLRDILVANMAEALRVFQANQSENEAASPAGKPFNTKALTEEYMRITSLNPTQAGIKGTKGGSSLPSSAPAFLMGALGKRVIKMPDVMSTVTDEAQLQKLTQTVEQIIETEHLTEKSMEELAKTVADKSGDKRYKLDNLLQKAAEVEKVAPQKEKTAQMTKEQEKLAREQEKLARDLAEGPARVERNKKFLDWLGKNNDLTQPQAVKAEQYLLDHPSVREAAKKLNEAKKFQLDIPEPVQPKPEKKAEAPQAAGPGN